MTEINQYIGIPYVPSGRSADGWDCYGLVKHVFKAHRNVDLPDWHASPEDLKAVMRTFRNAAYDSVRDKLAEQIASPEQWAIVLINRRNAAHHIGVYLNGGVLHCAEHGRTQWNPWNTFTRLYGQDKVELYRWLP